MKIKLWHFDAINAGFAVLNGSFCWLSLTTGAPIMAAMLGASCLMGLWFSRGLFEYLLFSVGLFFLKRRARRHIEMVIAEIERRECEKARNKKDV